MDSNGQLVRYSVFCKVHLVDIVCFEDYKIKPAKCQRILPSWSGHPIQSGLV